MATTTRKIDWPLVAALGLVLAAVLYALERLDPARVEAWLALVPTLVAALVAVYAATRGRVVERVPVAPTPERRRKERRDEVPPPAAGLALLLAVAIAVPNAGCTPAQKAAFEGAVLSALEMAAKAAGRELLSFAERELKFGDGGEP